MQYLIIALALLVFSCNDNVLSMEDEPEEVSTALARKTTKKRNQITICKVPPGNPSAAHTIKVNPNAWKAHEKNGSYKGPCKVKEPESSSSVHIQSAEVVSSSSVAGYQYFEIEIDEVGPGGPVDTVIITEASFGTWIPGDSIHTIEADQGMDIDSVHTILNNLSGNSAKGKILFSPGQLPWKYKMKCNRQYKPGHLTIKSYELLKYKMPGRVKLRASNNNADWVDILDFSPPEAQNAYTPELTM